VLAILSSNTDPFLQLPSARRRQRFYFLDTAAVSIAAAAALPGTTGIL